MQKASPGPNMKHSKRWHDFEQPVEHKKGKFKSGVVMHSCNPSIQEAKAGGL
jgi:hypothetical protein